MNNSEKEFIALCKRLIEEKFHFENGNGSLRQRDLEYLADSIEEKSGIKLSLSTLKRLWKKDYDQTPHPSTLDALASILGYKSWQDFKLKQQAPSPGLPVTPSPKKNKRIFTAWTILPVVLAVAVLSWLIAFRSGKGDKVKPVIKGPVSFTGNKTVSQGVPNTVIFNYDLSNVEGDSFFFQQSWNNVEKVKLDPKEHYYSNIYYYPGFHKAKLIANDSIINRFKVHITTDGWLPLVRYSMMDRMPVYLKNNPATADGILHVSRNDLIASNIDVDKDFLLSYYNIRDFGNTGSDNFSVATRVRCDSSNTVACPGFQVVMAFEEHIYFVSMMKKGCEREVELKMGEVYRNGANSDLSAFGRNVYEWQDLRVEVINKKAIIYLNEQNIYTISFKNDFGKIVGLVCNFAGTGAVDYVKLKNGEGKMVYEEGFGE